MEPDPYIQFLENWIPGIGEDDQLHIHFDLGFSVNEILLGFQLGHHPAGSFFHVVVFCIMSVTIYPSDYRNTWTIQDFYEAYLLGKYWQSVSIGLFLKQYYARRVSVGRKIPPT